MKICLLITQFYPKAGRRRRHADEANGAAFTIGDWIEEIRKETE